jgi:quercetin dioxygenase-like cupin family protein
MATWCVTRWEESSTPDETSLHRALARLGIRGQRWSNGPGVEYATHEHPYRKVIYVLAGAIEFELPDFGERIVLAAGDRLDLPAHTRHHALVGKAGVACLEAYQSPDDAQL